LDKKEIFYLIYKITKIKIDMKKLKHLKTFESFSLETPELIDEGLFGDLFKPKLNERRKKLITDELEKLDTNVFKFMYVKGKDKDKTTYTKDGYIKLAEKEDNFNGSLKKEGDAVIYIPASFSSSSGGLKGTGGAGG
jgi:hypothetical protein